MGYNNLLLNYKTTIAIISYAWTIFIVLSLNILIANVSRGNKFCMLQQCNKSLGRAGTVATSATSYLISRYKNELFSTYLACILCSWQCIALCSCNATRAQCTQYSVCVDGRAESLTFQHE